MMLIATTAMTSDGEVVAVLLFAIPSVTSSSHRPNKTTTSPGTTNLKRKKVDGDIGEGKKWQRPSSAAHKTTRLVVSFITNTTSKYSAHNETIRKNNSTRTHQSSLVMSPLIYETSNSGVNSSKWRRSLLAASAQLSTRCFMILILPVSRILGWTHVTRSV